MCGVAVGVAAAGLHGVGAGVGTPLDHAEGEVGTGELADGARAHRARSPVPSSGWTRAAGSAPADSGRRARRSGRAEGRSDRRGQGAQARESSATVTTTSAAAPRGDGPSRSSRVTVAMGTAEGGRPRSGEPASARGIRGRVTARCHARHRGCVADRRGARARLRDDRDRPLQRRPGVLRAGLGGRRASWSGAGRVSSTPAVRSRRRRPRSTASRRSGRGPRACRSVTAISLVSDAVVAAVGAWRSPGRDEARLRPDHPRDAGTRSRAVRARRAGMARAGARRRRHRPPLRSATARAGARSSICARTTGSRSDNAHDASADAIASIEVLFALAAALRRRCGGAISRRLHHEQIDWHREWTESYDSWRLAEGMIPIDPRDYVWPVAPRGAAGGLRPIRS